MGVSGALHVFEEEPVQIPIELTGVYKAAGSCEVVIYTGLTKQGTEVDRIEVDTEWGQGTATWTPPKLEGDEVCETYNYRVEVMGFSFKARQSPIMKVWARQLELSVLDGEGQPLPQAEVAFRPSQGEQVVKTDDAGLAVYALERPEPVEVDLHAPWYAVEWVDKVGRQRKVKARVGFKAALRFPTPDAEHAHKQWVNVKADPEHPEYGSALELVVASEKQDPAFVGQSVWVKVVAQRDNSQRTPAAGQMAPGEEKLHELQLDDQCQAKLELELGHAGGDLLSIAVGGCEETKDAYVWVETWRRISYELIAPDFVELPTVTTLEGQPGVGLPQATYDSLKYALLDVNVSFDLRSSRRLARATIPQRELFSAAYMGLTGRTRWLRDFYHFTEGDPPGLDAPQGTDVNVLLVDGLLRYEPGLRALKLHLEEQDLIGGRANKTLRVRFDLSTVCNLVISPEHVGTGEPTLIVDGAYWTARPDEAYPDHPGWNPDMGAPFSQTGDLQPDQLVAVSLTEIEVRFAKDSVPGQLVGDSTAKRCPLEVGFQVRLAYHMAGVHNRGNIASALIEGGEDCAGSILAHELGHGMGMTVITAAGSPFASPVPPGLDAPKTVDDGGTYYVNPPPGEAAGAQGFRLGQVGPHCADGISDKAAHAYDKELGACLMFGSGNAVGAPWAWAYCDTCVTYLRARKLDDVVSAWNERAEG